MKNPFLTLFILLISLNLCQADQTIKLGMSAPFSGPAKNLGLEMKTGIETYFKRINESGGIHNQLIELIALDDGYEPTRTQKNVLELINQHQVISFIGNVGTPTTVTILPILNQKKVPLVAPFTGASAFRDRENHPYVFNYRASYQQETAKIVQQLSRLNIKPSETVILSQDDSYGNSGYLGVIQAAKSQQLKASEFLHVRYSRNTLDVEMALAEILIEKVHAKAFIIIGAYEPSAKFTKLASKHFPSAKFFNVSFVGSEALASQTKRLNNIYVSQVVPDLHNNGIPLIQAFHSDLKRFSPHHVPSLGALEGYISALIMVKALKQVDGVITSSKLIKSYQEMTEIDIGLQMPLATDQKTQQFSDLVWLSTLVNGEVVYIPWEALNNVDD